MSQNAFEDTSAYSALIGESAEMARRRARRIEPAVGLILGSGLGGLADEVVTKGGGASVPYEELPGFPVPAVEGHSGKLVIGKLGDTPVAVLSGRVHYYEGWSMQQVQFGTRVLAALGVRGLIVTNAAGGIHPDFEPGDLMVISDHLNFMGTNPLRGPNDSALGVRFPDMSTAYHPSLRAALHAAGKAAKVPLREGVYAAMCGPSYETPAEIRMLRTVGADAVGMSTVPEIVAAGHAGVRACGVSCITNLAAGISKQALSHEEVKETADRAKGAFSALMRAAVPLVAAAAQKS